MSRGLTGRNMCENGVESWLVALASVVHPSHTVFHNTVVLFAYVIYAHIYFTTLFSYSFFRSVVAKPLQTHVATLAAKPAPGSAEATTDDKANDALPGASGGEEDLAGAERVLERDR